MPIRFLAIRLPGPEFFQKSHFFMAMSPMCNTFLGSLGVADWVHPVYGGYGEMAQKVIEGRQ